MVQRYSIVQHQLRDGSSKYAKKLKNLMPGTVDLDNLMKYREPALTHDDG